MSIKQKFKDKNMSIQFWGYEGGNLAAVAAGAGGFMPLYDDLKGVATDAALSIKFPLLRRSIQTLL